MKVRLFAARGGDCFLVDFENGHCILIDGGYSDTYKRSLKSYLQFLHGKGRQLDYVILTHYDADHINGLIAFLRDNGADQRIIKVGEVGAFACSNASKRIMSIHCRLLLQADFSLFAYMSQHY